ncbi:hypothetical protein ACSHWB_26745 [Lentzea sp. HUAS TT2]|uniref:hypothetical protein n=1 Tax=Lentzea sp. HUAS TT2 TaxID=3447454 RepID=UPI003F71837A
MNTSKVVLVDLRGGTAGAVPVEPAGGVVVLDHATSLVEHSETYLSLLGGNMVTAVVCIAIGESGTDNPLDGVVLAVPPALRHATVLWVGDPEGVDWAPESAPPRPAEQQGEGLDGLIAALQVPALFDQVVAAAEELPGVAANPGFRMVSSATNAVELAEARAAAVRSLCTMEHLPSHDLGGAIRQAAVVQGRDGAVLTGPVAAARTEALRRLGHVAGLARVLRTPKALFGSSRPTERLGTQVVWAGQAVENYRLAVAELLRRVDGHVQAGRPSIEDVVELGVQHPREADRGEISEDLRQAVDARLHDQVPLPVLAHELRLVAANSGPQGCTTDLDEVAARGPLELVMPGFRQWPLTLLTLPLIFLSCGVLTLVLGPGWPGWGAGALLAAAWFGSGWLLLARRPGKDAEHGGGAALVPALLSYGLSGLLGVVAAAVAGWFVAGQIPGGSFVSDLVIAELIGLSPVTVAVLTTLLVVFCGVTIVLGWRSAVRDWRGELRLADMENAVVDLTRIAEDVVVREWQPLHRRQAIAAVASEVAAGLEEISASLDEAGNRLFILPLGKSSTNGLAPMMRPVPQELYAVVRGDLADVCRGALEPAWPAAATSMRTAEGVYAQRLDRLLGEYGGDVRRNGLLSASRFGGDEATRDALMARVWSESPAALVALRTQASGDMTQLCRGGQLGYLSTSAAPGLVRFGPVRLRRMLEQEGVHRGLTADPGITWGEGGEFVGALRLLPLRPESVRQVAGGGR